jgi:adenylate kinase family enzyme
MNTPQDPQLHKHIVSKNGLLFDQISRQIIREFYEKSKTKSKTWIWWHKNLIVTCFETLKAQRDFDKALNKSIKESLLFKLITKLDRWLSYHFC